MRKTGLEELRRLPRQLVYISPCLGLLPWSCPCREQQRLSFMIDGSAIVECRPSYLYDRSFLESISVAYRLDKEVNIEGDLQE